MLKLDDVDYREHHLSALLARHGSVGDAQRRRCSTRSSPRSAAAASCRSGKRIVLFSPHPDDDVISAGGDPAQARTRTATRSSSPTRPPATSPCSTTRCGATSTSCAAPPRDFDYGNERLPALIARRRRRSSRRKCAGRGGQRRRADAQAADPRGRGGLGDRDAAAARRTRPASSTCPSTRPARCARTRSASATSRSSLELLEELRPEIVLVAGDLSDPHGTHRMCMEAVERALERYGGAPPEVWFYRGAWQEWSIAEADMLVPLSEEELRRQDQRDLQAPEPEGPRAVPRPGRARVLAARRGAQPRHRAAGRPARAARVLRDGGHGRADAGPAGLTAGIPGWRPRAALS